MTALAPALGVLAALVGIADTVPYVRDILRGTTRPHRGTWLIWSALAIVVCLSQRSDGASWSLVMAGAQAVLTTLILGLAIRRGEGGLSAPDLALIAVAGTGVLGWIVAGEPVVATVCVVAADLIAAGMMVPKTYRDPGSETLSTYALASLGGALAAGAVGALDVTLLLYPLYYAVVNGAIALLIVDRRRALRAPAPARPAAAAASAPAFTGVRLVGDEVEVRCVDGRRRRYVNLDSAASTSALPEVADAVEAFMPWYSSVHRGTGAKSQLATKAFEDARGAVSAFVRARPDDDVVFVRNTTEAINVLAAALPPGTRVLGTPVEHHANLLPWRRHHVELLPFPESADALCAACERTLREAPAPFDLVAVTGASNVTGELWPLTRLAAIAHAHGAKLFVDAAQLAPHRAIDMAGTGIDLLAFSGHKLYAPFGAGALVGDLRAAAGGAPLLRGGGAIKLVTLDDVIWADGPERHEAGSPNVVGVVALAAACRALSALGMDAVERHERRLSARLRRRLAGVEGLQTLALWPGEDVDRLGLATFQLAGYRHPHVAAILAAEHAIGVRHGCFCAHPLMTHLLATPDEEVRRLAGELRAGRRPALPGAVRASIGLGTAPEDVDRLTAALPSLAERGSARRYRYVPEHDEYRPAPPRPAPRRRDRRPARAGAPAPYAVTAASASTA